MSYILSMLKTAVLHNIFVEFSIFLW